MTMYSDAGDLVKSWYAVGKSKKFGKKPTKVRIFDIDIVCWRKDNGEVAAILDRCNHRNVPLSEGRIVDQCIVCPYHGWKYDDRGQCVQIPSEGPNPDRIPNKHVEQFPVKEIYGLVWLWMGRSHDVDKEPFEMPLLKEKKWHHYYMVTQFENNVTDLVENFMDVPHTVFVHKGWFRDRKQIRIEAKVERTENSVLVTYDQSNDAIGFSDRIFNPKKLPMQHTDNFYMPNNTRVDYIYGAEERGFIITSTCTPVSPFLTNVYTLITYKFGWWSLVAKRLLHWYTKRVINQDVWIMKVHGDQVKKMGQMDYRSTQCDTMHLYIQSLRKAAKNKQSPPNSMIKNIEFWI